MSPYNGAHPRPGQPCEVLVSALIICNLQPDATPRLSATTRWLVSKLPEVSSSSVGVAGCATTFRVTTYTGQ